MRTSARHFPCASSRRPGILLPLVIAVIATVHGEVRQAPKGSPSLPASAWRAIETDDTLALLMNGVRAGTLFNRVRVDRARITVKRHLTVAGTGTGAEPAMRLEELREYGFDGNLGRAEQHIRSPAGVNSWFLERKADRWRLRLVAGGKETSTPVDSVHESLLAMHRICRGVLDSSIRVGDSWRDSTFDMTSATVITETITCTAVPGQGSEQWVFSRTSSIDTRTERWELDSRAKTVYMEMNPFVAERAGANHHEPPGPAGRQVNVFELFTISQSKRCTGAERTVVKLDSGLVPDSSVRIFYEQSGGGWSVKNLPSTCRGNRSRNQAVDDSLRKYLAPTPTMQVDDKRVRKLADSLSRGDPDVCSVVSRFNRYVYKRIEKKNTATFSSALETLEAGFGDCGEHAVLLAALLRAAGIPSRVVIGLVYLDEKKASLYHAWVMAWDGGWLFADPALGVFPAPRDRVPLLIDDTGSTSVQLVKFIDRIELGCGKSVR